MSIRTSPPKSPSIQARPAARPSPVVARTTATQSRVAWGNAAPKFRSCGKVSKPASPEAKAIGDVRNSPGISIVSNRAIAAHVAPGQLRCAVEQLDSGVSSARLSLRIRGKKEIGGFWASGAHGYLAKDGGGYSLVVGVAHGAGRVSNTFKLGPMTRAQVLALRGPQLVNSSSVIPYIMQLDLARSR